MEHTQITQCCYQNESSNTRLSVLYMESGGHGKDLYKLSVQYMGLGGK